MAVLLEVGDAAIKAGDTVGRAPLPCRIVDMAQPCQPPNNQAPKHRSTQRIFTNQFFIPPSSKSINESSEESTIRLSLAGQSIYHLKLDHHDMKDGRFWSGKNDD